MEKLRKPLLVSPEYNGPTNFSWMIRGIFGGCPRPGIFRDITRDLEALERVGTRLLVTLTEEWRPDAEIIGKYGMESLYVPIPDLAPPTIEQARETCEYVSKFSARGEATVFHCHAGKGRTGTLLTSMLIWNGQSSDDAITYARSQNPKWIETESQLAFLAEFDAVCRLSRA